MKRSGGFAEEERVERLLMGARERQQFARQRERDQGVITREQQRALPGEPALRSFFLAGGTVAVATRVVRVLERGAVVTAVKRPAHRWRAIAGDVVHGCEGSTRPAWTSRYRGPAARRMSASSSMGGVARVGVVAGAG